MPKTKRNERVPISQPIIAPISNVFPYGVPVGGIRIGDAIWDKGGGTFQQAIPELVSIRTAPEDVV